MTLAPDDIMVPPPDPGEMLDARAWSPHATGFEIEIGCGKGGFLLHRARAHPGVLFLGIEWANKYYRFTADRMARWGIPNVRVMRADAKLLVERQLPPASVDALHVYHPDPWPKKRHHKRRLFQPAFAEAAARVLVPGGRLLVQTDHEEYFQWIEAVLGGRLELQRFSGDEKGGPNDLDDGPATNFELKYRREGRAIFRAGWRNAGGPSVEVSPLGGAEVCNRGGNGGMNAGQSEGTRVCWAIVSDLIFATRLRAAASHAGWQFRQARSAALWEQMHADGGPALAFVDMNIEGIDPAEVIRYSKQHWPGARIVAYHAHVQSELRDRAREAGADEVLPRSRLVEILPDLLA